MLGYDCCQQSSGRRAPGSKAAHARQQLSRRTLGEQIHVMKPTLLHKIPGQLVSWGSTTAHKGVTQGVCSSFRPRCAPSDAQHICMLEQCCSDVCGHLAWCLFEQRCQRLMLFRKQVAVGRPQPC